jgi:hypothetical protein
MTEVHGENGTEQQRLARAVRRNAGGGGSSARSGSWLGAAAAGGGAGGMRGDRSEAVKVAGAGVMASLLEASGRAAARQKHLQQNLTRTSANLTGALEEVERVRVSARAFLVFGLHFFASWAVKAAGAGVMASLLEAAGRAAARQKHLRQDVCGALEETTHHSLHRALILMPAAPLLPCA